MTILEDDRTVGGTRASPEEVAAFIAATEPLDLPAALMLYAAGVELLDPVAVTAHMERAEQIAKRMAWIPFGACMMVLACCYGAGTLWVTSTPHDHGTKVAFVGSVAIMAAILAFFTLVHGLFPHVHWVSERVTAKTRLPECAADIPPKVWQALGTRCVSMRVLRLKADPVLCIDVFGAGGFYGKVWDDDGSPVTIPLLDLSPLLRTT